MLCIQAFIFSLLNPRKFYLRKIRNCLESYISAVLKKHALFVMMSGNLSNQGGRALLNLGHTFGHAIEAVAGYGKYLHGEAVAIGWFVPLDFRGNEWCG